MLRAAYGIIIVIAALHAVSVHAQGDRRPAVRRKFAVFFIASA